MKIQAQQGARWLSHFDGCKWRILPYTVIKHGGIAKLMMNNDRQDRDEMDMKSDTVEHSLLEALSRRERQILRLVAEGKTSREIAETLTISSKTVDTYRSRLMRKINVKNVAGVIKFAVQHRIIKLD
jgi:RNA polymerase sigma factor (sigma-70 family)